MLTVSERGRSEEFGHPKHPIHWRANFMTHRREELTLGTVRRLCSSLSLLQVHICASEGHLLALEQAPATPHDSHQCHVEQGKAQTEHAECVPSEPIDVLGQTGDGKGIAVFNPVVHWSAAWHGVTHRGALHGGAHGITMLLQKRNVSIQLGGQEHGNGNREKRHNHEADDRELRGEVVGKACHHTSIVRSK